MKLLAILFAIGKSVIYGMSVIFTGSLTHNVDTLDILALRFLLSAVVFWLLKITRLVKIRISVGGVIKNARKDAAVRTLFLAALFEPVLYMLFETVGISMTSGIVTGVVLSLSPISSCIFSSVFLKEGTTFGQKVFLGLGILGVILISVRDSTGNTGVSPIGIGFLVMAVLCASAFMVCSRKSSRHYTPMEVTYFSSMLGALIFNSINIVRHLMAGDILNYFAPYCDWNNLYGFFFLAVCSTIIATGMNNYCLGQLSPAVMSSFSGLSTLVTILCGVLINHEAFEQYHAIGLTLIVARMVGVNWIQRKRELQQIVTKEISI